MLVSNINWRLTLSPVNKKFYMEVVFMFKATNVDEERFQRRANYYVKRSKNEKFLKMKKRIGDDKLFIDALCICNKLYETSTPLTQKNIKEVIGDCTEQYKRQMLETIKKFYYLNCTYWNDLNICLPIVFPNGNKIRQTQGSGIFGFVKFLRKET